MFLLKKNNNPGCFSAVLGTVIVLVGVVIYAILSSLIYGAFARMRFGEYAACFLFPLRITGIIVAFILFEAIFIVWQVKTAKMASKEGDVGGKMARLTRIVLVACICLSLLFSVFCANTYTDCRENSISKVCFVPTKEYRWDTRCDVLRYNFSCDPEGGLTVNLIMKDGEIIELFGAPQSISDSFKENYRTSDVDLLAYAAHLASSFDESDYLIYGKVTGIENMEKSYKESHPAVWAEIQKIIDLQE